MNNYLLLTILVIITACSSAPKNPTPENMPDQVIGRIDDLKSRPDWIQESKPFRIDGDVVASQGFAQIPSDHNLNAAYRICFNNAKAHIASAIEQKLEYVFQQSNEGTELDSATAQFIGSEMSSLSTNLMRSKKQYYEKVATTLDSGERKTVYKVFCLSEMPVSDFKKHLYQSMKKAENKGKISASFQQKVDAQWNRFVGAPITETQRDTASDQ